MCKVTISYSPQPRSPNTFPVWALREKKKGRSNIINYFTIDKLTFTTTETKGRVWTTFQRKKVDETVSVTNSPYIDFCGKLLTDTAAPAVFLEKWEINLWVFCPRRRWRVVWWISPTWSPASPTPPSSPRLQSPPSHQISGTPDKTNCFTLS